MLIFQISENPNLSELWEDVFKGEQYNFIDSGGGSYEINNKSGTGILSITEQANVINFEDNILEILFLRYIALLASNSIIFEDARDEIPMLLIPNQEKTPKEVLESYAIHAEGNEIEFLTSFKTLLSNDEGEEEDLPPKEKIGMEFVNFIDQNPNIRDVSRLASAHIVEFYANSKNMKLFSDPPLLKNRFEKVIYELDQSSIGFLAADFEIIIDRIEEYEDNTFGFYGELEVYTDLRDGVRDDSFYERGREKLLEIAASLVNEIDFEVAVDDLNQAADSMLVDDHPGEWMTLFKWNNGEKLKQKEFFSRNYE